MPPVIVAAAWPAVAAGVAVVVGVCLWLLFRPGSMADRARRDHADDDAPGTGSPSGSADGSGQRPAGGA